MSDISRVVVAINATASIFDRRPLTEEGCAGYLRATGMTPDQLVQALLDWTRSEVFFPMPRELIALVSGMRPIPAEAGEAGHA